MERYNCNIIYAYDENELLFRFKDSIKLLGFEPNYMRVFINEFEPIADEVAYEEVYLLDLINKNPRTITIIVMNSLYDSDEQDNFFWFRFSISNDASAAFSTYSFEWSNSSLNFLISNSKFIKYIDSVNLICCYCFNQNDCNEQSNTSTFNPNFRADAVSRENSNEFILNKAIDISKHWGRHVSTKGIIFMAAPLMWFGNKYFTIIPKDKLQKFSYSVESDNTFMHIKLFDLYDDPTKSENRKKQKEFWTYVDLKARIEKFENDNPIDYVSLFRERANSMNVKGTTKPKK